MVYISKQSYAHMIESQSRMLLQHLKRCAWQTVAIREMAAEALLVKQNESFIYLFISILITQYSIYAEN